MFSLSFVVVLGCVVGALSESVVVIGGEGEGDVYEHGVSQVDPEEITIEQVVPRYGMGLTLLCPMRYFPRVCNIKGFGSTIKGLKAMGVIESSSNYSEEYRYGCVARINNLGKDPIDEMPMKVACTPYIVPDPCGFEPYMQAHNTIFSRNTTTSLTCPHGYVMHSCALTVIAPDLSYLRMKLPDDTGLLPIVNNSCSIKDCVEKGTYKTGIPYNCSIQAVCMPDRANPTALCDECDPAECSAQNMTCGHTWIPHKGLGVLCRKEKCDINTRPGYRCELCLKGIPAFCSDINECLDDPQLCGDGQCTNLDPGFICTCKAGPCTEPGCADAHCGTNSCFQRKEDNFTRAACGEESVQIVTRELTDNVIQLECVGALYMMLDAWFIGDERVRRATTNAKKLDIDRTKLETDVLVTCQLQSLWLGKIARDSITVTAAKKEKKSEKKSVRKLDRDSGRKAKSGKKKKSTKSSSKKPASKKSKSKAKKKKKDKKKNTKSRA